MDFSTFAQAQEFKDSLSLQITNVCKDFNWTLDPEKQEELIQLTVSNLNFFNFTLENIIASYDSELVKDDFKMRHAVTFIASVFCAKTILEKGA